MPFHLLYNYHESETITHTRSGVSNGRMRRPRLRSRCRFGPVQSLLLRQRLLWIPLGQCRMGLGLPALLSPDCSPAASADDRHRPWPGPTSAKQQSAAGAPADERHSDNCPQRQYAPRQRRPAVGDGALYASAHPRRQQQLSARPMILGGWADGLMGDWADGQLSG